MHDKRKSEAGFTLVELLIVIAIIAVLAAILLPILAHARERANQTKCMSNLRNLAIALNEYADDNHGRYPGVAENVVGGLSWPNGRTDDGIWATRIDGYLGGAPEIWACPSADLVGIQFREEMASAETGIPYGINNSLSMKRASDNAVIGRPTSAPKSPRTTVILIENDGYDAGGLSGGEPTPARRHLGQANFFNVVYCDSNAECIEETRYPEDWDLE